MVLASWECVADSSYAIGCELTELLSGFPEPDISDTFHPCGKFAVVPMRDLLSDPTADDLSDSTAVHSAASHMPRRNAVNVT